MDYYIATRRKNEVGPWIGPYISVHAAKIEATKRWEWTSSVYKSMELLVGEAIDPFTIDLVAIKSKDKWKSI